MKHLSLLLLGIIIIPAALLVGFLGFWPSQESAQPAVVVSVQQELNPLKTRLAQQEADYLAQMEELKQRMQTQQAAYQTRTQALNAQILTAQNQLDDLQHDARDLQLELSQLQTTRIKQAATNQVHLKQARAQYDQHLSELKTQLEETRLELNRINLQRQSQ